MVAAPVGVLALQGDVREHVAVLAGLGVDVVAVRTEQQLAAMAGLVIPGGESTAIARLLETSGMREPLSERLRDGLPVLGTCAGLILLSRSIVDGRDDQWSFSTIDVDVRRNGFGRQIASFETTIEVDGVGEVPGVFIRAPKIESWSESVTVLATHDHGTGPTPVLVRQGAAWGCSFHPELTDSSAIHELFLAAI